jgi:hypothetical protein
LPVHPRACGEHITIPFPLGADFGSSPRLRGTRFFSFFSFRVSRFIPAPAGNTLPRNLLEERENHNVKEHHQRSLNVLKR